MNIKEFKAWCDGYKTALKMKGFIVDNLDIDLLEKRISELEETSTVQNPIYPSPLLPPQTPWWSPATIICDLTQAPIIRN